MKNNKKLNEGLDPQDLEDRIESIVHFDEYKPKLGNEDAIIVATFKVMGKQAAMDLENFIEKGYDWAIDAETSAGEISKGNYLVFVEAERRTTYPKKFMDLINDLNNLTNVDQWKMVYYSNKDTKKNPVTELNEKTLSASIPLSPKQYRDARTAAVAIESILNTARVPRKSGDINEFKGFTRTTRD